MIGVPAAADIGGLRLRLAHLGDLGMAAVRREIIVDVDRAPAPREGDVILGRQLLIANEQHAAIEYRRLERIDPGIVERLEIDARCFGAAMIGDRLDVHFPSPC